MAIVTFDPAGFVARYPEFATVGAPTLTAYFYEATIYLDNTDASRVQDVNQRAVLLNMLVAHIAALNVGVNGAGPSALMGSLTSASQGTESASTVMSPATGGMQAWLYQTKYGFAYWGATGRYRQAVYIPYGC